eukprot:g3998.t1
MSKLKVKPTTSSSSSQAAGTSISPPYSPKSRRASLHENESLTVAKSYIVNQNSKWKKGWDIILAFSIYYSIIAVPYQLGFNVVSEGSVAAFEIFIDIFFVADIVLNFFTSYDDPETLEQVFDLKRIRSHYLKTWFTIDFLSTIPFDRIGQLFLDTESDADGLRTPKLFRSLRLFKLMRLLRMLKLGRLIDHMSSALNMRPQYFDMIVLIILQFLIAHYMACLWHGWSSSDEYVDTPEEMQSWIHVAGIESFEPLHRYLVSLYWAFTTMTTVGYGDIGPVSASERILAMFMFVIGVTIFGYTISSVTVALAEGSPRVAARQGKRLMLAAFLESNHLPKSLHIRIRRQLKRVIEVKEMALEERGGDIELFKFLFPKLQTEVLLRLGNGWGNKIHFFREGIEKSLLASLYNALIPCIFFSEMVIYEEGHLSTQIYFLLSGEVRIQLQSDPTVIDANLYKQKQEGGKEKTIDEKKDRDEGDGKESQGEEKEKSGNEHENLLFNSTSWLRKTALGGLNFVQGEIHHMEETIGLVKHSNQNEVSSPTSHVSLSESLYLSGDSTNINPTKSYADFISSLSDEEREKRLRALQILGYYSKEWIRRVREKIHNDTPAERKRREEEYAMRVFQAGHTFPEGYIGSIHNAMTSELHETLSMESMEKLNDFEEDEEGVSSFEKRKFGRRDVDYFILSTVKEGQMFGMLATLRNHRRLCDAYCPAQSNGCFINKEDLEPLILQYPLLGRMLNDEAEVREKQLMKWATTKRRELFDSKELESLEVFKKQMKMKESAKDIYNNTAAAFVEGGIKVEDDGQEEKGGYDEQEEKGGDDRKQGKNTNEEEQEKPSKKSKRFSLPRWSRLPFFPKDSNENNATSHSLDARARIIASKALQNVSKSKNDDISVSVINENEGTKPKSPATARKIKSP